MTIESQKQKDKINLGNINRLESIRYAHNIKREECTNRMEDYLEVIYELIRQKGYATAIDISESLNVSSPSVTKMLKRLDENKYLRYEKYRGISLTGEGIAVAENILLLLQVVQVLLLAVRFSSAAPGGLMPRLASRLRLFSIKQYVFVDYEIYCCLSLQKNFYQMNLEEERLQDQSGKESMQ